MPAWFPWIVIGGIIFILLGWMGTRYKDREYRRTQSIQDFISGAICVGFMGVLVPDLFPTFDFANIAMNGGSLLNSASGFGAIMDDEILQVGPPRLIGR